jgi:hypothetical protein
MDGLMKPQMIDPRNLFDKKIVLIMPKVCKAVQMECRTVSVRSEVLCLHEYGNKDGRGNG